MTKTLILDGGRIHDIPSLYAEINRVFMADETWQLAPSLDALDDLLYGGYGAIQGKERVTLIWLHHDKNRVDLGEQATRAFYEDKLRNPRRYNQEWARRSLAELEEGTGSTYFETVLEIIAGHPNISLDAR
ncbi:Uncharacterised protein [Bordetella ansorpii]|uniref:Uncharacterized protein n=1 Tax=Bordetella ansorpii TaxID=288768 RepID=A0A157QA71_9BORD|nr:ribonuclease inhibitor [Bordetella ansorpii]SAI42480.1 Uncharacterised protein [Bordetella ansorpii]